MPDRVARHFGRRLWAAARIGRSAWRRFNRDDGTAMAGYIAYSVFLSLFPFAIFMSALAGHLIGPSDSKAIVDALFQLAPDHVAQTLEQPLSEVIGQSRGGVITFSAIAAVWIASNAVEAVRVAFDRAYDSTEVSGYVRNRLVAIGFVFFAGVVFAALGVVVILAPLGLRLLESYTGFEAPLGVGLFRYGLGLCVFALFLFTLNRWLPGAPPRGWSVLPGIVVSTILWIAGAAGFSIYLAYAPDYTLTYGAFAGVIVTLLFFYLTGAVVIFGAEVNAALLAFRQHRRKV